MATISLGTSGNLQGQIVWSEGSVSTTNNTSVVTASLQAKKSSATTEPTSGTWTGYLTINGTKRSLSNSTSVGQSWKTLLNFSVTVTHNTDGSKSISIGGQIKGPSGTSLGSNSVSKTSTVSLTKIARYATATQTMSAKTETTIKMQWSSDATVDYIWYSSNGGSSWTGVNVADGTGGSYTISGLTAGTTYSVKTRVRRKDNQLTTETSAQSIATYAYPYASDMPNFTIGDYLTLKFYNPLGRTITFSLIANGTEITGDSWTTSGTSYKGFTGSGTIASLYASIPNATSATYRVKVTYGSNSTTKTGGTYAVNTSVCKPTIGTVSYNDAVASVVAITGNNQKIVQNQSWVHYTAAEVSANYSATIDTVDVVVNNVTVHLSQSGTTWSGGGGTSYSAINSGTNVTARFVVTDSRGVQTSKNQTIQMVAYNSPSAIITLERQNNFYTETDITVNAEYTQIGSNAPTIRMRTRKKGGSYGSWTTLQNNTTTTFNADNQYAWDVQIQVTDTLGGSTTYNRSLSRGMPIIFFDRLKSSVGVNCFPTDDESLEVAGVNLLKELFFSSGETITMSMLFRSGFVTSSATIIYFDVPMPKKMGSLTPTLTGLQITCRSVGGVTFINNVDVTGSAYTLSINKRSASNTIRIDLKINSGTFNALNNSPVSIYVNSVSFSFA